MIRLNMKLNFRETERERESYQLWNFEYKVASYKLLGRQA